MTRRRVLVLVAFAVVVAAAAALTALVALPVVARRALVAQIRAATGREVSIDALEIRLGTGHLDVRGFHLADHVGDEPLATFDHLEGRLHRRSLLRGEVRFESLTLTRPRVRIVRTGRRAFNISDLLARPRAGRGWRLAVAVDRLAVVDGRVQLEDQTLTPARAWASEHVTLEARNVSTTHRAGTATGSAILAGAPVAVSVSELRLSPVHLRAQLTMGVLDLAVARIYTPADAPIEFERGRVSAAATVVHDARDGTSVDAAARLTGLVLGRRGQTPPFLRSPELTFAVNGLHVAAGTTTIGHFEADGDVEVTDGGVDPPASFPLTNVRIVADDVTWPPRRPGQVSLAAGLRGGGTLTIAGGVQAAPPRAALRVRLARVPFAPFAAYVPITARVDGIADADVAVTAAHGDRVEVTVRGTASVERAAVADRASASASPFTAERITATDLEGRWPDRLAVARLHMLRPHVSVERDASGAFPLRALLTPRAVVAKAVDEEARRPVPAIVIGELVVEDAALAFADRTMGPPAAYAVTGATLTARDLAWPPSGPTQLQFTAPLPGGGSLATSGTVRVNEPSARVTVTLTHAALAQVQPYVPFPARVRGAVDAQLDLGVRLNPLGLRARGMLAATDLAFADDARDLLTVERLDAAGVDVRWPGRLGVQRLRVKRPWAAIARDTQGQLSLRTIFTRPPPTRSAGALPSSGRPPLEIAVDDALFEDGSTTIVDDAVDPPARFEIAQARLAVQQLRWPTRSPAAVQMSVATPRGGQVDARGTLQLEPPIVDMRATLSGVDLRPAQPYLPVSGRIAGHLDGTATVRGDFTAGRMAARGSATVTRFSFGDADRALVRFGRIAVDDVDIAWPERQVTIGRVAIDEPWILLERDAKGAFPLFGLLRPHESGHMGARRRPDPSAPAPLGVSVGAIALSNGTGRFADATTTPEFMEDLSGLSVAVEALSTAGPRPARFKVAARVGADARLEMDGQLGALAGPRFLDLSAAVHDYAVPRGNRYYDRLVGWIAKRGSLDMRVHYRVEVDDLDATNEVDISGLEVAQRGMQHEVRRRIGLPLDLLVALLKNPAGDIHVSVPVRGRLSSPEFDFSEAVWGAVRNLMIRLIALPFGFVGKMFFTEDSRIETLVVQPVTFEHSTATPAPGMADHLAKLVRFLKDKPAVKLQLRPVLTLADVEPLKHAAVTDRIRAAARDASPAAMSAAAARLFTQRFPGKPVPPTLDAIVAALAEDTRPRQSAVTALATSRVEAVRAALASSGIELSRLPAVTTPPPVESGGDGRVELDITH